MFINCCAFTKPVNLRIIDKILTEMCGISLFTCVTTRLIRNFPKLIPAKPGCKLYHVRYKTISIVILLQGEKLTMI